LAIHLAKKQALVRTACPEWHKVTRQSTFYHGLYSKEDSVSLFHSKSRKHAYANAPRKLWNILEPKTEESLDPLVLLKDADSQCRVVVQTVDNDLKTVYSELDGLHRVGKDELERKVEEW
jgi:hypothetical protein